jgi:hypothetical protein
MVNVCTANRERERKREREKIEKEREKRQRNGMRGERDGVTDGERRCRCLLSLFLSFMRTCLYDLGGRVLRTECPSMTTTLDSPNTVWLHFIYNLSRASRQNQSKLLMGGVDIWQPWPCVPCCVFTRKRKMRRRRKGTMLQIKLVIVTMQMCASLMHARGRYMYYTCCIKMSEVNESSLFLL